VGGIYGRIEADKWYVQWFYSVLLDRIDGSHISFFTGPAPLKALSSRRLLKSGQGSLLSKSVRCVDRRVSHFMRYQGRFRKTSSKASSL
jgi:hypothetical protein